MKTTILGAAAAAFVGGVVATLFAQGADSKATCARCPAIAGATFAASSLSAFLFGVAPRDPATLAAAAGLVAIASAAALYLPLRRAAAVDPVAVLRQ
jgi:ABC-type antimicrobial peptide transport system permease subunit